jgi:hypothetical protein
MNSIAPKIVYKDGWPVKPPGHPTGMVAEVTWLRERGKKLSLKDSLATTILCEARWKRNADDSGMAFKFSGYLEFLDLKAISGGQFGRPIFDPFVEEWTSKGIVVSGWEINTSEGGSEPTQHYQVLLVKPALAPLESL